MRRLEVNLSGRWYLALTIGLGVVAMVSANNVLYLIESLLLSGLILSGILSERAISAITIDWLRGRAVSGEILPDRIRITNRRGISLFCVEIGQWQKGAFVSLAYLPRLGPRGSATLPCRTVAGVRGLQKWEGLAVATSYPFGLARKIRYISEPGERLIWPSRPKTRDRKASEEARRAARRTGGEISDGEVRAYDSQDDSRMIVWTLSAKGQGPMVRVRRRDEYRPQVTLDLREEPGQEFEAKVAEAARPFHELELEGSAQATLTVVGWEGKRKIHGRVASLDELACAEPEGQRSSA